MLGLVALSVLASSESRAGPGRVQVTELGRRVLSRCDAVVEATVVRVSPPYRGVSTARLKVSKHLYGYGRDASVTLMFVQDYVAPDAFSSHLTTATVRYERTRKSDLAGAVKDIARGKLPKKREKLTGARKESRKTERADGPNAREGSVGIRLARDEQALFFLRRRGATFALVGYITKRDILYESKRKRLEGVLRLEGPGALDTRLTDAKVYFLKQLASTNLWERGNAARELRALARRDPRLFSRTDGRRIAKRMVAEREPPIQWALERAVHSINPNLALQFARKAETEQTARHAANLKQERERLLRTALPDMRASDLVRIARRYRRAAAGLLVEFLSDRDPIVRERVAQSLAELGSPAARKPLREALAREKDENAASALIYACGMSGDPRAVPILAAQLGRAGREQAALHALARIGTDEARAALEKHRPRTGTASRKLIDTMLREEFPNR